jgi:hypothetical protein
MRSNSLLTVSMLSLLWLGDIRAADKQEQAIAALKTLGAEASATSVSLRESDVANVDLIHLRDLPDATKVSLIGCRNVSDAGMSHLAKLEKLETLYLPLTSVGDDGLSHLKGLTALVNLYLSETRVTDAGLAHLNDMGSLRVLYLDRLKLTDSGLAHLRGLDKLVALSLNGTKVSDAGLKHLGAMSKLSQLHLNDTTISDAGIEQIARLISLAHLELKGSKVTEAGAERLQRALPKCKIVHGTQPNAKKERADALAREIDRHIALRWEEAGVMPAPPADDAEFLRRVWLDLAGKLPPPSTVREFLANQDADKRCKAIDELLDGPGFVTHFAAFWRDVLIPEVGLDGELQQFVPAFEVWLQRHLARDTSFDRIVYEILTAPLVAPQTASAQRNDLPAASAIPFFAAKQISPENLAAATSRAFLGIRVECAQCHDHPFDRWKQQEFWGFASFFGGLERLGTGPQAPVREVFDRREMMIPNTQTIVQATYLDGTDPQWRPREGARQTLARWIVSPDNPYFARAAANRIWGHFFGYGLVDPVDDFSEHNPPSHPQLLDELAQNLVRKSFDLKFLMRAIALSRTYQLSSHQTDATQTDPRLFARMPVRGLSPHQVRQVFAQATGLDAEQNQLLRLLGGDRTAPPEQGIGVLWALAMMNGAGTSGAAHPDNGPVLGAIVHFPMSDDERIDALYLATLSRFPTGRERLRLRSHIESNDFARDRAYADIYWHLINASEFLVNH